MPTGAENLNHEQCFLAGHRVDEPDNPSNHQVIDFQNSVCDLKHKLNEIAATSADFTLHSGPLAASFLESKQ